MSPRSGADLPEVKGRHALYQLPIDSQTSVESIVEIGELLWNEDVISDLNSEGEASRGKVIELNRHKRQARIEWGEGEGEFIWISFSELKKYNPNLFPSYFHFSSEK